MGYFGALALKINNHVAGTTMGRLFRLEGSGHVWKFLYSVEN